MLSISVTKILQLSYLTGGVLPASPVLQQPHGVQMGRAFMSLRYDS